MNNNKVKLISVKGMTEKEIIDRLSKDSNTSISNEKAIEYNEKSYYNDCPCYCSREIPFVNNSFEHAQMMLRQFGTGYGYENNIIEEEYDSDKATAATDFSQRGIVEHLPEGFEYSFPNPIRNNVAIERSNNTKIIDALMDIDEQAIKLKADINNRAIEAKAKVDMIANRQKYETLMEYNTMCGMHRQSAIMCRIVEDFEPKNKKDD